MKRFLSVIAILLAITMLAGCVPNTNTPSESTETTEETEATQTTEDTTPAKIGWVTEEGNTYYYLRDGSTLIGLVSIGDHTYYFDASGVMQTGWATIDSQEYYFLSDGKMAKGQVEIDGRNRFFTAYGEEILIVNPWNPVPDGYDPDLVKLSSSYSKSGSQVSRVCYDALVKMISDCNKECPTVYVTSSYRTYDYQAGLYENRIKRFQNEGHSREEATKLASAVVAPPGTSEHHLGLAVDIIDTRNWELTEVQDDLPGQKWLIENCWKYGFILRYPKDSTDSTGIIYEPWHYRYVGVKLATEIHNSQLTLEEYFAGLTN